MNQNGYPRYKQGANVQNHFVRAPFTEANNRSSEKHKRAVLRSGNDAAKTTKLKVLLRQNGMQGRICIGRDYNLQRVRNFTKLFILLFTGHSIERNQ
jgi:hypothetical protein